MLFQKGMETMTQGNPAANAVVQYNAGGMTTTASGLQYKAFREGSGAKPSANNTVTVHYRGVLLNGTQFDSSYDRDETISFPLRAVIAGWTEGLQLMAPGAHYLFYIPSKLAYGARGVPGVIPADAPLLFEVELISFE